MKNRLPIHCCCEPSKRLGWLTFYGEAHYGMPLIYGNVRLEVALLQRDTRSDGIYGRVDRSETAMAIKSNDYPLEVLSQLPGFEFNEGEAGEHLQSRIHSRDGSGCADMPQEGYIQPQRCP